MTPSGSPSEPPSEVLPVPRRFALVGPGRAGTAVSLGLVAAGWSVTRVAGRAPDADSTRAVAATLEAIPSLVSDVGLSAEVVIIATPDRAIGSAARAAAGGLEPEALVVHLSGAHGVEILDPVQSSRPSVRLAALHPLQTLRSGASGADRLAGSWAAVAGDDAVLDLAAALRLRPFRVRDEDRAVYHAAAAVAANHLVSLMGQVERLASSVDVPFDAFLSLARAALDNVDAVGPAAALTGPVARGDRATVERHLAALDATERDAYRALAREAARLASPRPSGVERLTRDLDRSSAPDQPSDEIPGDSAH